MKPRFIFILIFSSFLSMTSAQAASDEAAVGPLLKAVESNPKDPEARSTLAYAYERQGRIDEAITQYQKAIELNPRNAVAHNNLGVLYDNKGLHGEAIRQFEKAVDIEPSNATGPKNLENAKKNQSAVDEREKQIAEALKKVEAQPENPRASYTLARLYAAYGKKEQALQWLEKSLKLGFNDIAYLKVDSALDNLRNEPDYVWLLRGL